MQAGWFELDVKGRIGCFRIFEFAPGSDILIVLCSDEALSGENRSPSGELS